MLENMTEAIVDNDINMDCVSGSQLEEPRQIRSKTLLIHTHNVLEVCGNSSKM